MKKRAIKKEFQGLLKKFSSAMLAKLMRNEERYNFGRDWALPNWEQKLQADLPHHVRKGDARDVGIYAFFAWYHKWRTGIPGASKWVETATGNTPWPPVGVAREYWAARGSEVVSLWYGHRVDMSENAINEEDFYYTGWMEAGSDDLLHPLAARDAANITHFMDKEPAPAAPGLASIYATGTLSSAQTAGSLFVPGTEQVERLSNAMDAATLRRLEQEPKEMSASVGVETPAGLVEIEVTMYGPVATEERATAIARHLRRAMYSATNDDGKSAATGRVMLTEFTTHGLDFTPHNVSSGPVDAPAPLYTLGKVAMVEVTGMRMQPMGKHPVKLVSRTYTEGYGWFYRVDFLFKNEADNEVFGMGFDYAEKQLSTMTVAEWSGFHMSAHGYTLEEVTHGQHPDAATYPSGSAARFSAQWPSAWVVPNSDVMDARIMAAQSRLRNAMIQPISQKEWRNEIEAQPAPAIKPVPKYVPNQLVWVKCKNPDGSPIGVFPALVLQHRQHVSGAWFYDASLGNSINMPTAAVQYVVAGSIPEENLLEMDANGSTYKELTLPPHR